MLFNPDFPFSLHLFAKKCIRYKTRLFQQEESQNLEFSSVEERLIRIGDSEIQALTEAGKNLIVGLAV